MNNLLDNPKIQPLKTEPTGLFTNYIYKAIPLAFDESMSYYEMLCGLLDYLKNNVIPTLNNNADAIIEIQKLYTELKSYVDNYFTNLDVQKEINNKLDKMAQDGSLYKIIEKFVKPALDVQNENINNFKTQVNNTIDSLNTKINQATSITPLVVSSINEMTNPQRIYVLSSNGNWYYYDKTNHWSIGGQYQSSSIERNSIDITKLNIKSLKAFLKNKEINLFNNNTTKDNGFYNNSNNGLWANNNNFKSSDFIPVISDYFTIKDGSNICFFNSMYEYIGNSYTENATYLTFAIDKTKYDGTTSMCVFNGSPNEYMQYLEIKTPISIYELDLNLLKTIYQDKIVNLFDKTEYIKGGFYNHNTNGKFTSNKDFISTGLIPVINNVIYSNGSNHFCFYDKNLNFVGSSYNENAYYMREAINISNSNINNIMICFGGQPSIYLPFLSSQSKSQDSILKNIKLSLVGDSMVTDGYAPWKNVYRNKYNATLNNPIGGHGGDITNFSPYVNQINTDCDAIIVWAGTNDWYHNQPIGNISDTPSTGISVLASWKYVLEYLTNNLPTKKILAITPSPRWYKTENTPNTNNYGEHLNNQNYSLRELANEIEKLCNLYSIPCINMMNVSGWNKNNYTKYLRDGIHQNANGGNKVANLITSYLTNFVL